MSRRLPAARALPLATIDASSGVPGALRPDGGSVRPCTRNCGFTGGEVAALVDASLDVVLVLDREGRYLKIGSSARGHLYRPPEELLGHRIDDVLPPELVERMRAVIATALATGSVQTLEYELEIDAEPWPEPGRASAALPTPVRFAASVAPTGDDTVVWVARDVSEKRRAEAALRASEARFRAFFDQAGVGIALLEADGRLLDVNPAFEALVGYAAAELRGRDPAELLPPDDAATVSASVRDLWAGRVDDVTTEHRFLRRDGAACWGALTMTRIELADGRAGFVALVQDVTARRESEAITARLTEILELTPDVVAMSAPDGRLQYVNRAGRALLGLGDALPPHVLTAADVQPEFVRSGRLGEAVRTAVREGVWRGEATLRKRDGRELPVEQVILAHRAPDGSTDCISTVVRDLTERRHVEAALRELALVDELTGLYNRRGFMAMAEQEWRRARRAGWRVSAFYLDLDDFKAVNDVHGHAEGDRALAAVAAILRATFRESDVIGRPGGDEFTVLVAHADAGTEATVLARLDAHVAAHNAISGAPYALALSVGVARVDTGSEGSLADLVARADAALFERKRLRGPTPRR